MARGLLAASVLLGRVAGTYEPIIWIVGLSLFGSTVLIALLLLYQARRDERHLAAFERGEFLVYWTYQPGEGSRYGEVTP